jgi:hypothetical protein
MIASLANERETSSPQHRSMDSAFSCTRWSLICVTANVPVRMNPASWINHGVCMAALRSQQPNLDVGSVSSMHCLGNRFAAFISGGAHLFRHVYFPTRLTWPIIFLFSGYAHSLVSLPVTCLCFSSNHRAHDVILGACFFDAITNRARGMTVRRRTYGRSIDQ